jgi:hypothetical protein
MSIPDHNLTTNLAPTSQWLGSVLPVMLLVLPIDVVIVDLVHVGTLEWYWTSASLCHRIKNDADMEAMIRHRPVRNS